MKDLYKYIYESILDDDKDFLDNMKIGEYDFMSAIDAKNGKEFDSICNQLDIDINALQDTTSNNTRYFVRVEKYIIGYSIEVGTLKNHYNIFWDKRHNELRFQRLNFGLRGDNVKKVPAHLIDSCKLLDKKLK